MGSLTADNGERLWLQCHACHTLKAGEPNKLGPNLAGIIDAPAGARDDFSYSPALAQSGLVWDRQTLDAWIAKPSAVLTGHRMVFAGIDDPEKRRILLDYIAAQTATGDGQ